jgi:hypothetical protein
MKIEVSNGEIVDKLTILQIKEKKCYDSEFKIVEHEKLKNIQNELRYLEKIVEELFVDSEVINCLAKVNQELWDIEDQLRIYENKHIFDDEFIRFARLVYITNDKRFEIKNQINDLTMSIFKEEKILPKY